jgi:hypothetical protein
VQQITTKLKKITCKIAGTAILTKKGDDMTYLLLRAKVLKKIIESKRKKISFTTSRL